MFTEWGSIQDYEQWSDDLGTKCDSVIEEDPNNPISAAIEQITELIYEQEYSAITQIHIDKLQSIKAFLEGLSL